ncbi:MAG: hypothetical protein OER88_12785 [Planctomycetota bacterium]|nr:hypothetical protein [Planctomycetota bacterium]
MRCAVLAVLTLLLACTTLSKPPDAGKIHAGMSRADVHKHFGRGASMKVGRFDAERYRFRHGPPPEFDTDRDYQAAYFVLTEPEVMFGYPGFWPITGIGVITIVASAKDLAEDSDAPELGTFTVVYDENDRVRDFDVRYPTVRGGPDGPPLEGELRRRWRAAKVRYQGYE